MQNKIIVFIALFIFIFSKVIASDFETESNSCGLTGSVAQRIEDCAARNGGFVLVTRTQTNKEIFLDEKSQLLWGEHILNSRLNHQDASNTCASNLEEVINLPGLSWRLPTKDEFANADKNGLRGVIKNVSFWWWSSTVHHINSNIAWVYYGASGGLTAAHRTLDLVSVRCVANLNK